MNQKARKKDVFNELLSELMRYRYREAVNAGGYCLSAWCSGGSDRVRAEWHKKYRYALNK